MAFAQERSVRKKSEQTAATETRLALIIGNSDYLQTSRLRNPVNDARSISKTLRDLGFSVTTLENADKCGMDSAIRKFGKTLRKDRGSGPVLLCRSWHAGSRRKLFASGGYQSQHGNRCEL